MSKIKVLHVTYDMRIGGTEQVIKNLIDSSDTTHFEMSILCIESPLGPFANDLLAQGIAISTYPRTPGFDRKLITKIRQHIKQYDIDILHCHQYTPWVYGALAALGTKAKVIFTEHGRFYPDTSSWKRRRVNPWLHRITAATTAISSATKDALTVYENLPAKDTQIIYNGIAPLQIDPQRVTQLKQELGISDTTLCLGTIARLDPIKNHAMMLHAFKQVTEQGIDAKLIIVGDGEMREVITTLINELCLQESVILTGYQTQPQSYLALMDIYLLSSLSEGTSMTLLEAMSIGKPCIVTDAGGNPEIIEHEINGLVTPNDDAEEFALAIEKLAKEPLLREKMASASSTRFREGFTAKIMIDAYQQLYRTIR